MNIARPSEWTRAGARPASGTPFAGGPQHYFAFLSYSHRDAAMAKWLHDELEKFRVPFHLVGRITEHGAVPRRLTPIFRDMGELPASDDLGGEIRAALIASRFLVVLCSPAAACSRWTNAEIEAFKHVRPDGCVFAAIVDGEPFASELPGHEEEECLPRALRFKYDRRGRATAKRAEPLAADFRETGEGKRLGFLKLVAGMLGVGLDDLVQRDTVRRHRRLAMLTAASLAGMVVTSGLAISAVQSRDEARDQRREAEGLVAFMLGDLKEKLEPIGRLDALDGVGSRVLRYYSKQDASELGDAGLLQRAGALSLMAQVAYLRGKKDEALGLYREALKGTAEAVRREPSDPQRVFDHAQNVFWIAEIARDRGRTDQAEAAYREYKRLADRLVSMEPDNLRWRMEALYGVENVGIALYNKRHFAEAAQYFEGALRPMENLVAIDADNLTYRKELSTVLAWSADAERAQGNLDRAIALRERQVSMLEGIVSSGVDDVDFRRHLIPAREGLGLLLSWRGQTERGIEELRAAVDQAYRLIPIEPENTMWKSLAAGARLDLARTLLAAGRGEEAARETAAACAMVAAIKPADVVAGRRTTCLTLQARLALQAGARSEALLLAQQALATARNVHSEDPLKDRYIMAGIYRLMGDARRDMGDAAGARAAWSNALALLPKGVAELPLEMDEHAAILRRLGRATEAQQIAARLDAMQYQSRT